MAPSTQALMAVLEHRDKEIEALRKELREASSTTWIWTGDEEDDLGSMGDSMVICITAGQLRRLLGKDSPGTL